MRHVVLGAGEIGRTIAECCIGKYMIYDKGDWESMGGKPFNDDCILNVCIPYSTAFVSIVKKAISMFMPHYIVIHSTVKPGTCRRIDDDALYSPVNGRHGDGLVETVKSYPKLFAGDAEAYAGIEHFYDLRCVLITTNRDELEAAKIFCTTYTGINLIYQKAVHDICKKNGYNFELVYNSWNRVYNDGMDKTHPEWKRPIYDHMPGKIGGHCIIKNCDLMKNSLTGFVKNENKKAYI